MENGKKCAFAYAPTYEHGLTKREYFTGLAMQGLLTRSDGNPQLGILESKRIADESVVMADALLKELEKDGSI